MTVKVEGLRQSIRSLERLGVEAQDLKDAFHKAGNIVVTEARALAPKRTGKLAGTIKASKTKNKSIIRTGNLVYAPIQHYGWPAHGIEPKPYMTDAVAHKQDEVVRLIDVELQQLVNKLNLGG